MRQRAPQIAKHSITPPIDGASVSRRIARRYRTVAPETPTASLVLAECVRATSSLTVRGHDYLRTVLRILVRRQLSWSSRRAHHRRSFAGAVVSMMLGAGSATLSAVADVVTIATPLGVVARRLND